MTEKDCPERFVAAARAALERRAEALDAETVARLADLRREALAQRRAPRRRWVEVAGVAAVAASALLVVSLWFSAGNVQPPGLAPLMEDLELLSTREDLELFEDLDFYLWLTADDQQTG